jgi:hypothetical protein
MGVESDYLLLLHGLVRVTLLSLSGFWGPQCRLRVCGGSSRWSRLVRALESKRPSTWAGVEVACDGKLSDHSLGSSATMVDMTG